MLNSVAYMTDAERKGTLQFIKDIDAATKIDSDVVLEAMSKGGIFINDLIHINMLKCRVLMEMKKPIYPFTADDYIYICAVDKEEDRRYRLSEVLTKKDKEYRKMTDTKILSESDVKNKIGQCLPKKGDDSEPQLEAVQDKDNEVGGIAVDRLRSLIERIERLQEEASAISSDIRDIFAEAKSAGFDTKVMRSVIKLRKMNAADRDEQEFLLDTYRKALDI